MRGLEADEIALKIAQQVVKQVNEIDIDLHDKKVVIDRVKEFLFHVGQGYFLPDTASELRFNKAISFKSCERRLP